MQISCCGSDAGVTAALLEDALRSCKSGGTLWIRHICSAPMFCSLGVPLGKPVPSAVTGDVLLITLREEKKEVIWWNVALLGCFGGPSVQLLVPLSRVLFPLLLCSLLKHMLSSAFRAARIPRWDEQSDQPWAP